MPVAQNLQGDKRGVVYVEFLLVFPPLFTLFLVILQWSILGAASLGVQHAASSAVRSAIVVLPDDPVAYDNKPIYSVRVDASCSEGFVGKFNKLISKIGLQSGALPEDGKCPGGPRMDAIRFAAITRMIPFAPNASSILPAGMAGLVESLGTAGWLAGAALYSYGATAVNFPMAPGSETMVQTLGGMLAIDQTKPLTVRVNYLAHCGIPIARFLMCESSHKLGFGIDTSDLPADFESLQQAYEERNDRAPAMDQLALGVGNHTILTGLLLSGERFMLLSADATLPMNSAPYAYKVKQ